MGAPEIVTGSRDGTVKVWDPRTKDAVVTLQPTKLSANDNKNKDNTNKQDRDCWAVAFGNSFDANNRCIVSGYDNGDLKFLDLKMNKLYWETNLKNGVVMFSFYLHIYICVCVCGLTFFGFCFFFFRFRYFAMTKKTQKAGIYFCCFFLFCFVSLFCVLL